MTSPTAPPESLRVRVRPLVFLTRRLRDPRRLSKGLETLGAVAVASGAAVLLLAIGGASPPSAPWLGIPADRYFYWEAAFIAPVIFLGAILAAGTMHLLARAMGAMGPFDDAIALLGVTISVATLVRLIPDAVIGALLSIGVVDARAWMHAITHPTAVLAGVWVCRLVSVGALLYLCPVVAGLCYRLRGWRAVAVGWGTFAVYQGFVYVFVR